AVLTGLCALSTMFKAYDQTAVVKIEAMQTSVKRVPDYSSNRKPLDLGYIKFNLDADFTKTFDWNTKELFLYLTAHYATATNEVNQVILWDHILRRGESPILRLRQQSTKYYFFDDGFGLKGNP